MAYFTEMFSPADVLTPDEVEFLQALAIRASFDADNIALVGGGVTVETPTGTINGVNDTFTVTAEPKWVVADGVTYYDGDGYTYSAFQIVMSIPPSQYIKAII